MELGVYLHFPWCRKLCPYCDFAVEVGQPDHEGYLRAIEAELAARAPGVLGRLVSIYVGGGTPSLWRAECLAAAIAAIRARFPDAPREVTLEANPTDITAANLAAWRDAGVNRLSIGVQSLDAPELVVLGRDHRFGDGAAALDRALAFGGFAVSCDFILGVPGTQGIPPDMPRSARHPVQEPRSPAPPPSTRAEAPAWIAPITQTAVDHLSVYELTIEERTAFGKRAREGRLVPLPEDALVELYVATHDALAAAGFEHYEISSYARPGRRAVHNALYWRGAPFLGLGVGAASLHLAPGGGGVRATNPRRVRDYLAAPGRPAEVVAIGAAEMAADRAWLGMRTSDGVAEDALPAALATELVGEGLAERRSGRICPTLRGFLMADRIAAQIVQAL